MKRFIINTTAFALVVLASFVGILSLAGGYTDAFYRRFTTPEQNNLILGTSRAAQGVQPEVVNNVLNRKFFNYSFTIDQSPFGYTYLESIKGKLNENERNGIFIVTIDPWSIFSITANPNDSLNFREVNLHLGEISHVNLNPNFPYLLKYLKGKFYEILINPFVSNVYLHQNGWFEVEVSMDSVSVNKRTTSKIKSYRKNLSKYEFSSNRFKYLEKTIEYLNEHGDVYLVRLPVHPEMVEIEKQLMPDFNNKIQQIIPLTKGYYDMTALNSGFKYTDGNHLYKESGKLVSYKIAHWIKKKTRKKAFSDK